MLRKISVFFILIISMMCITGCASVNLYRPSHTRSHLSRPDITNKGVIIFLTHTRNFSAINDGVTCYPQIKKEGSLFTPWSQLITEQQIFNVRQNPDHREFWQIFTLPTPPGRYKLHNILVFARHSALKRAEAFNSKPWLSSTNTIDVKKGEFVYVGMVNCDALGRRKGLGEFLQGPVRSLKFSFDSSPKMMDYIRKTIPELKNVEIIHKPFYAKDSE